jgi:hypothetical protein
MTTAAFRFASGASLAKYQATAAAVVPLTLDSVDGVRTVTWSVVSTDETSAGQWTITNPTSIAGATLTAPGSGTAKACIVECVVNNGSETDPRTGRQVEGDLRKRAKAYVGTEVACVGEVNESDATFGWVPLVNTSIRIGGGGGSGEVDPIGETIAERTTAGALLATSFQGDAAGATDTVLARSGDTRIALTGSGVIALQRWSGAAWVTLGQMTIASSDFPLTFDSIDKLLRMSFGDEGGLVITGGNPIGGTLVSGEVALGSSNGVLSAYDGNDPTRVRLNRAEPSLHSSGSVTLVPDGVYILSGTATAGALPEASGWIGIRITVVNRTAGPLSIARSGSDTIDGATSYSLPAGAAAVFMAAASGSIAVQSDAGISGGGGGDNITAANSVRMRAIAGKYIQIDRWDGSAWEQAAEIDASQTNPGIIISAAADPGTRVDIGTIESDQLTLQANGSVVAGAPAFIYTDGSTAAVTHDFSSGTHRIRAGSPMLIQPTQATSGAGRALTIGGGAGQTPGTHLAGDTIVDLGARVGTALAAMTFLEGGTNLLKIGAPTFSNNSLIAHQRINSGFNLWATESGSSVSMVGNQGAVIQTQSATAVIQLSSAIFRRLSQANVTLEETRHGSATIASATTTNVATFPTTADRVYQVIGRMTVSNDTDDQGAVYWVRAAFKRVGGTVTQIGSTQTVAADLEDAGQTGLAAVLDFSGTDIRLRLTTDAADTVNVNGILEINERVLA